MHLSMKIDGRGGTGAWQRGRQDGLLYRRRGYHLLTPLMLRPKLSSHFREGADESGEYTRLTG
jgi:hypothetical protein